MNRKKITIAIISTLLIGVLGTLISLIYYKVEEKTQISSNRQTLPDFQFEKLDQTVFTNADLNESWPTVFIAFKPECGFCKEEGKAIEEHLEELQAINIVMVSYADVDQTMAFSEEYHLENEENLHFVLNKGDEFYQQFGSNSFPSIFIYNQHKELVKHYLGETKIEAILTSLKSAHKVLSVK